MAHLLIYGGTFDPIHLGHLLTCRRAREILNADRIALIPARISPYKTEPSGEQIRASTPEERLAMIRLAIADSPNITVDPRELSRPGPSYTVDTLEELQREFADGAAHRLTLLLGADQLPMFHGWRNVQRILELADVAVMVRPGSNVGIEEVVRHLPEARERMRLLATPLVDVSATEIRRRVREGLSIDALVPAGVADFIRREGLYRATRTK